MEATKDDRLLRCPIHNHKLWPKAVVRKIRFHDLRHTTASLLIMRGADLAAVQRILRPADPKTTTEIYGHLAPGYLQAAANRLSFDIPTPNEGTKNGGDGAPAAENFLPFSTRVLPETEIAAETDSEQDEKANEIHMFGLERAKRLELSTLSLGTDQGAITIASKSSQPLAIIPLLEQHIFQPSQSPPLRTIVQPSPATLAGQISNPSVMVLHEGDVQ